MKDLAAFRLDPLNQCLWRSIAAGGYERVDLTPTEFGVLDHLVANAGRLVTHRELLDAVWPRTAIEPQAVKSRIFQLRRALDDDPRQPRFIETLPRRGYRFVGNLQREVVSDVRAPAAPLRLAGRDGALAELWQCMDSARAGRLEAVFVTGEPGIGKTAVVEEMLRQVTARDHSLRVARGQCIEGFGSKEAFYPVLEAMGELCRRPDGSHVVDTLATQAPTWLVQFPALLTREHRERLREELLGGTRERMLREICEALQTLAKSEPLVLVLEDLHWADSSTLDLISALARRRVSARILIVATYRPTDVARSAQPLHALKRELVARHLCREIVLQPLAQAEIAEYLAAGRAVDESAELASLLHRHSEGNPLFMLAILEHLASRGLAERDAVGWKLGGSGADIIVEVPDSLREMIGAQVDRLDDVEQRVLEAAAIAGMSFAPTMCAQAAGTDAIAFEECCNVLARRGHVLRVGGTRELPVGTAVQTYAFSHALYREVLYERQPPARRSALHRRLALRLEELAAEALDEAAAELAHHFELGGDWQRAITYLRREAEAAAQRHALHSARLALQRGLSLVGHLRGPERAATEVAILDALGILEVVTSRPTALDTLSLLRARAAEHGLPEAEAKALIDTVLPLSCFDGQRALEAVEQALRLAGERLNGPTRTRVRAACMVRRITTSGWSARDAAECASALDEIRGTASKRDVGRHVNDCAFVDLYSSHYRQAHDEVVAGLRQMAGDEDESAHLEYGIAQWNCDTLMPWSLNLAGDWGAAIREADERRARAERNSDGLRAQMLWLLRAWVQLNAMDFSGTRAICDSALAQLEQPSALFLRRFAVVFAGAADAGLLNHDAALSRLLALREEMDTRLVMLDWYRRLLVQLAITNVHISTGELARADDECGRLVALAGETEEHTYQALAWESYARVALASGELPLAHDRVRCALSMTDGYDVPVAAWQVHAAAAHVSQAAGDLEAASRHREASSRIVAALADSLDPAERELRQTFLSAARNQIQPKINRA